jgi:E3 ubiquitin-protein ligase RFWD2
MASGSGNSHKRKRGHGTSGPHVALFSGVMPTLEDKDNEFVCPICFNLLREAHMTRCGHTFCYECILKCFESNTRCPKCNFDLEGRKDDIFPNFLLNELVAKHRVKLEMVTKATSGHSDINSDHVELAGRLLDPK